MTTTTQPAAPRSPSGHAPLRRPDSVRRTSSMDVTWPEGRDLAMKFSGVARDLLTPANGMTPLVIASDRLEASLQRDRSISSISSVPVRAEIDGLVGERGGGHLRAKIDSVLPVEREGGTPLYLLLDDLSGTSLIAGWAWSRRPALPGQPQFKAPSFMNTIELRVARMESVCTGFKPGSSALIDITGEAQNCTPVVPLQNPQDPLGWHTMAMHTETSMRRARRIDVWIENEMLFVDSMFQDSASLTDGSRIAIHEYTLQAQVDLATMTLQHVQAQPRTLPYPECPSAADNVSRLVGMPLASLRSTVLTTLRKVDGCTHLNDALRALAEVPTLAAALR